MGGLFQIILFAYSRRGWKNYSETPHLGCFWNQHLPKIKKKSFRNRYRNQIDFQSNNFPIWAPFWTLRATLKFCIFRAFWVLFSLLGHFGAKRVPTSAPRQLPRSNFQGFNTILGRFLKIFIWFASIFRIYFPVRDYIRCYFFNKCSIVVVCGKY